VIVVLRARFKQTKQGESTVSLLPIVNMRKRAAALPLMLTRLRQAGTFTLFEASNSLAICLVIPPPPRFLWFFDAQVSLCNHLQLKYKAFVRRF
jgi:hypothetical protein